MLDLKYEVKQVVENELSRACEKHGGLNNSHHESYAIILEEFEEAQEPLKFFEAAFAHFWKTTRADGREQELIDSMRVAQERAIDIASEWVQVAAMCEKARLTAECKMEGGA